VFKELATLVSKLDNSLEILEDKLLIEPFMLVIST
jgi:hypothetical protein